MIKKLIMLFGIVVATMLGLGIYHLRSVNTMKQQPLSLFHWEDTGGLATVQEATRASAYEPVRTSRVNIGYTESVHWLRFRLVADSLPGELAFEIRNHTIDRLELFRMTNGVITSLGKTGSRYPFAQRPSPTKTFVYLLNLNAEDQAEPHQRTGGSADYYLRIDKRHENLTTELTLWQTDDFEDKEQREYFLWGLFTGVVGLIVLLAFLFYGTTRDPVYGWYGLYILFLALRQFADTGLGFQYLWPWLPVINQPDALTQTVWLYVPAMLQFQQYFLGLRTKSKSVFWATQLLKIGYWSLFIGLVICQALGLTESYTGANWLIRLIHAVMTIGGVYPVFIAVIIIGLRSSEVVKRVYAVGFGIQLTGQAFVVAQNLMSFRPDGVFFVDAYLILMVNFFIDLVIFAYLLAYRYRNFTDEQRQLRISLAQTRQHTNNNIIGVLESERQQVGSLLLTDVGGRLSSARAILTALPTSPLLTEAITFIQKTDASLDQILRDGLPPDLARKGLATALAELVQQRTQSGDIRLTFDHDGTPCPFSATQSLHLYRIASELITNMIKHAQATEGAVSLHCTPAGWQLTVCDNGRGFDVERTQTAGGIGLRNLYARAHTLGATIHLNSGAQGTSMHLLIPEKIQTS